MVLRSSQFRPPVSFTFNGGPVNDTMIIDEANGPVAPSGGVFFNGNAGTNFLVVQDKSVPTNTLAYTPDTTTAGNGVVTAAGGTITFTGGADVDAFGFLTANVAPGNATNAVNVANGTNAAGVVSNGTPTAATLTNQPALVISGSSGSDAAFTPLDAWNDTTLALDGNATADTFTVNSGTNAHGNTNLTIQSGAGAVETAVLAGSVDGDRQSVGHGGHDQNHRRHRDCGHTST